MNTLEALYFPGTEIYSGSQFPIFLLFQKTHILRPVEAVETTDNTADIFKSTGLCQAHTPCPLGVDRDRFLHLIKDIRERKDDYAAQLSSLTIASLSQKKSSIDDTQQGIVASLLGGHQVDSSREKVTDVQLWQARLVLALAEILDREEEEVAMQMTLLDDDESELFKALQGELDEDEESLVEELRQLKAKISPPTAGSIRKRLSAWTRLYLAGEIPETGIWLTHMPEVADILLEKYEERTLSPAKIIAEFELPANIGWGKADVLEQIQSFREQHQKLLSRITDAVSKKDEEALEILSAEWSDLLKQNYPNEETGRTLVTFYSLGTAGCGSLLGKTTSTAGSLLAVVG